MGINSPDNQDEEYENGWQRVYKIIAVIMLVSMFLYLVNSLLSVLGISSNGLFGLLSFPFFLIG